MVKIKWLSSARNDLHDIYDYISLESKRYAKAYIKSIKSKTNFLADNPFLGRVVPEIKNKNIREIIVDNYRIVYFIESESNIIILMVHHSARKFSKRWLK